MTGSNSIEPCARCGGLGHYLLRYVGPEMREVREVRFCPCGGELPRFIEPHEVYEIAQPLMHLPGQVPDPKRWNGRWRGYG